MKTPFHRWTQPLLVLTATLLVCSAITRQSVWIDEAAVAWFASIPSLKHMAALLFRYDGSDPQMPLYLLYMRGWVALFGRGEVVLRLSNVPFALLLLASMSWTSTVLFKRPAAWLLVALSPFLWFYMNEARPYVALMGLAGATVAAVLAYSLQPARYHRWAPWIALSSLAVALAFHMLSAFLVLPLVAFLLLEKRRHWRVLFQDWIAPVLCFSPVFILELGYYAWTIVHHAGGQRASTGIKNVLFVLYELAGFSGLGPPRNDLRAATGAVLISYLPWLLLGGSSMLVLGSAILLDQRRRPAQRYWLALTLGFVLALLACHEAHFRFLGRHLAVFLPLGFVGVLMVTEAPSRALSRTFTAAAFGLLAVAWASSDARLVTLSAYGKDDYRTAVADAMDLKRRKQETILWAADDKAAYYYGLLGRDVNMDGELGAGTTRDAEWPERASALLARNSTSAQVCGYLSQHPVPVLLVIGKPDIYDALGSWHAVLRQPGASTAPIATANAFELYELDPRLLGQTLWEPGSFCAVGNGVAADGTAGKPIS